MGNKKQLPAQQNGALLSTLKQRFDKNMNRHKGLEWEAIKCRLEADNEKFWSLNEMEGSGGEPDVVGFDNRSAEYTFYDCPAKSPKGRRSLCYDRQSHDERKEFKPENNVLAMAAATSIELLDEAQYRQL